MIIIERRSLGGFHHHKGSLSRCCITASRIFLVLMLVIAAKRGYAYYRAGNQARKICFQRDERTVKGTTEGVSVLYDNLDGTSSETILRSIMYARSINFVSADAIDCNIPVRIAVHHPVTSGNSLANLLYADLRLRKLYEEKKALRERSLEILAGLSVPFTEHIMPSYSLVSSGSSVHKETEELHRNYRAVRKSIRMSTFGIYKVDLSSLSGPDSWSALNMSQQRSETVKIAELKSPVGEKRELTDGAGTSREGENGETVQPNSSSQQKKKSLNHDKSGVPWIFKIFIKMQEILFSSPREVIISLLVVAFIVSLIFSGKRR